MQAIKTRNMVKGAVYIFVFGRNSLLAFDMKQKIRFNLLFLVQVSVYSKYECTPGGCKVECP